MYLRGHAAVSTKKGDGPEMHTNCTLGVEVHTSCTLVVEVQLSSAGLTTWNSFCSAGRQWRIPKIPSSSPLLTSLGGDEMISHSRTWVHHFIPSYNMCTYVNKQASNPEIYIKTISTYIQEINSGFLSIIKTIYII